ncbi:hypothetical protein KDA11_06885, partial [Candidatus Saccharibacteria bacterium]|nr:hypothetical protein [Candidatus Saccharibacteria bacterium]
MSPPFPIEITASDDGVVLHFSDGTSFKTDHHVGIDQIHQEESLFPAEPRSAGSHFPVQSIINIRPLNLSTNEYACEYIGGLMVRRTMNPDEFVHALDKCRNVARIHNFLTAIRYTDKTVILEYRDGHSTTFVRLSGITAFTDRIRREHFSNMKNLFGYGGGDFIPITYIRSIQRVDATHLKITYQWGKTSVWELSTSQIDEALLHWTKRQNEIPRPFAMYCHHPSRYIIRTWTGTQEYTGDNSKKVLKKLTEYYFPDQSKLLLIPKTLAICL